MERLKISTSVGLFRVPTDDIAYIEASGNYCDVHLFNGESVTMTFQLHYFVEVLGMLQQKFLSTRGQKPDREQKISFTPSTSPIKN